MRIRVSERDSMRKSESECVCRGRGQGERNTNRVFFHLEQVKKNGREKKEVWLKGAFVEN